MEEKKMYKVLTIAGSDSSGGAGVQADLKTIMAHKMYGMSVITALTAQNTTGVRGVLDTRPDFVGLQMDCIFTDIIPDAVKVGMVSNEQIIKEIAKKLKEYQVWQLVVDPVMVATSGSRLLKPEAEKALIQELIPLARVITPNLKEAEVLSGVPIQSREDMLLAAMGIQQLCKGYVLIKGGHLDDTADDLIYHEGEAIWVEGARVENPNTHGTGCTLSSAIACNLAAGYSVEDSIRHAKEYITGALKDQMNLGNGSGPLNHAYGLEVKENLYVSC